MTSFKAATPALPVRDLKRAVAFYGEALGFAQSAGATGWALLERDAVALHLWVSGDESWRERREGEPIVSGAESFLAGTASCRVSVSGIEDLYRACEAAKVVHPNAALKSADYGAREFAILDPDGNLMTFFEMA